MQVRRLIFFLVFLVVAIFPNFAVAQIGIIWQQVDSLGEFLGAANMDNDSGEELVYCESIHYIHIRDGLTGAIDWDSGYWWNIRIAGWETSGYNNGYSPFCDHDGDGKKEITFLGMQNAGDPGKIYLVGLGGTDIGDGGNINALPTAHALLQNHPNPFNPNTTIKFELNKPARATVAIYNILGQTVRTLVDDEKAAGEYSIVWDGKNDKGESLASGTYFYQLRAGDYASTKKSLLLK